MAAENLAIDREPAVGVIGAGHAGMAWARTALRAGWQVVIANSHGPDSLRSTVAALGEGALAGTVDDAVACAIVVLAVPWAAVASAVSGVDWEGRTVVDGTNPLLFPDLTPAPLGGRTSSEIVAGLVPGARLVKAASHLSAELLGQDPILSGGRRVIFVSGDTRRPSRRLSICSTPPASIPSTWATWCPAAACSSSGDHSPGTTSSRPRPDVPAQPSARMRT